MSTRNLRQSVSSSSSSARGLPSASENSIKKFTTSKPQLAKKRPALTDTTNQKNESETGWRVLGSLSPKLIVPCSAKIAKKKESSAHAYDKGLSGNTLPTTSCVSCNDIFSPRSDQSTFRAFSSPNSSFIILPTPGSAVLVPRGTDVSPSKSVGGSVSLDETMSTCNSFRSSEFEYIDNEGDSTIKSIEMRTYSTLNISGHEEREGFFFEKRDILVGIESANDFDDIDYNVKDPQFCATIASDIFKHLLASEGKKRPSADFMERVQKDINASMRAILIDWLVEVAEEYTLVPETLFLTVNYIDRYLSGNVVNRQKLQLLGVSCLMIAAKYEEIHAPQLKDFCYVTDNTCSKEEVLQMESAVLNYLKFEMTVPTAKCFLRHFVHAAQRSNEISSLQLECLANYIVELSLLDYNMLSYAPSLVAASATFLANFILFPSKKPWNSTLGHYTLYQPADLSGCVKALHRLFCKGGHPNLSAIREKYSQHNYKYVAKKYCPSSIPAEIFQDRK